MSVGDDVNAILKEIERLQGIGYKLQPGESWWSVATRNLSGGNVLGRIGQIASKVTNIPADLLRSIKTTAIIALLGVEGENLIQRWITEGTLDLNPIPPWLEPAFRYAVEHGGQAIGAPLFDMLVRAPLGIEASDAIGAEGAQAVQVLERLFGIGLALDFGSSQLRDTLKSALGENAPDSVLDTIRELPMMAGLNWAVGFIVSQFVTTAYMPPLVEQANEQVRPSRFSEANLLALYKRQLLTTGDLQSALSRLGWRDGDQPMLAELDRSLLTLGDLQGAWLQGLVTEDFVRFNLASQGYNGDDINTLVTLYLKKSETAGGDQLRAVAQKGYLDGHIGEDVYRGFLKQANVPQMSIDLEVEAANLVKQWGRVTFSVADIKKLRLDGAMDDKTANQFLQENGYTQDEAQALINDWLATAAKSHLGYTESQVLSWLKAGVLTQTEAYDRIVALGVTSTNALFVVQNTDAGMQTKKRGSTATDIISAYKDSIIDMPTAQQKLQAIGETPESAALKLQVANVAKNKGPKQKQAPKNLTESQILDAFRYGLANDSWTIRELVNLGWSQEDAMLIVTIEETKLAGNVPASWVTLD